MIVLCQFYFKSRLFLRKEYVTLKFPGKFTNCYFWHGLDLAFVCLRVVTYRLCLPPFRGPK